MKGMFNFGKLVESIKKKCSISTLRGEIEINRVNWILKGIFGTLTWYVIWLGFEIKVGKLNYGCCV